MRTDAIIRTRIDATTKTQAAAVLAAMGLNLSDAVRLLMRRIAAEQRLPFDLVPNQTTLKAMEELEQGKGKRFDSIVVIEAAPESEQILQQWQESNKRIRTLATVENITEEEIQAEIDVCRSVE